MYDPDLVDFHGHLDRGISIIWVGGGGGGGGLFSQERTAEALWPSLKCLNAMHFLIDYLDLYVISFITFLRIFFDYCWFDLVALR